MFKYVEWLASFYLPLSKELQILLFHFQNHALHQFDRELNCIRVKTFKTRSKYPLKG